MAKKPATPAADDPTLTGFPEHGDPAPDDGVTDPVDDGEDDAPADPPNDVATLKAQIADQQRQMDEMRRSIPPAAPKAPPAPPKDVLDETDWDAELFSKPKEAVKKIVAATEARVTAKLRGEYKQEQGQEKFWNSFYAKHKDLKKDQDHDLVQLTLNKNLAELANIPVDKALDKLADLTRDRIAGYVGGAKGRRPRAVAEGGNSPSAPRKPAEEEKPAGSLSEVLKRRKEKRRTVGA